MNLKDNKVILGALGLGLILSSIGVASTFAAEGGDRDVNRPDREAVKEAVTNNDYATWANLLSEHPKGEEFVNETTFNTLVSANELREAGDREGARELLREAGIKRPGKHHKGERSERRQAVREAVANNDYATWAELLANHPNAAEVVNESTFASLREAHALFEAGDKEAAKEIIQSLGLRPQK